MLLGSELQVSQIFFGQRRCRNLHIGQIDALVLGQCAAGDHFTLHVRMGSGEHPKLNKTVRKEKPISRAKILRQSLVGGRDPFAVSYGGLGGENKMLAGRQFD